MVTFFLLASVVQFGLPLIAWKIWRRSDLTFFAATAPSAAWVTPVVASRLTGLCSGGLGSGIHCSNFHLLETMNALLEVGAFVGISFVLGILAVCFWIGLLWVAFTPPVKVLLNSLRGSVRRHIWVRLAFFGIMVLVCAGLGAAGWWGWRTYLSLVPFGEWQGRGLTAQRYEGADLAVEIPSTIQVKVSRHCDLEPVNLKDQSHKDKNCNKALSFNLKWPTLVPLPPPSGLSDILDPTRIGLEIRLPEEPSVADVNALLSKPVTCMDYEKNVEEPAISTDTFDGAVLSVCSRGSTEWGNVKIADRHMLLGCNRGKDGPWDFCWLHRAWNGTGRVIVHFHPKRLPEWRKIDAAIDNLLSSLGVGQPAPLN
jgi:hypothetical protein